MYGPWGRPKMALFIHTEAIKKGKSIDVFNNGNIERDFTYISDIVEGIHLVINNPPQADKNGNPETTHLAASSAPCKIYNIVNNQPVKLMSFIE